MGAAFLPAREGEQWGLMPEDVERVRSASGARCEEDDPMGADLRDSRTRYLVHCDYGGALYRVERVEPPPNPNAFGHAWVTRLGGS